MGLKPKKFVFKNKFKIRTYLNYKRSNLSFGDMGLKLISPFYINSTQVFRFKLFLKKLNRKSDKTKRKVWFKTFPFTPLSKKPQGLRMGKGKGKTSIWFSKVKSGSILVESRNARPGRAHFFFSILGRKLSSRFSIVTGLPKLFKSVSNSL